MMLKITVCPACRGRIKKVGQDWTGEYQGQRYVVPDAEYWECEDCGEKVYDREAMKRIEAYSPAFEKSMETAR